MQKRSLLLVLAVAGLTSFVAAQQIVIEPTNGKPQSATTHVTRPTGKELAPSAKPEAKPAKSQTSATQKPATKHRGEKLAAKTKAPAAAEVAKNEPRETAPAPVPEPVAPVKKYPARPAWAMNDTRDPHGLEEEISGALARDAKLKGSSIQVKVSEEAVTLEGRATGTEERLQAERLAQSYAWNRKLVDHLEVVPWVSAQR